MTNKQKQTQIKQAEESIKTLKALIGYVELNKHKEWCWEIDLKNCQSKLRYFEDNLEDVIKALRIGDHEDAMKQITHKELRYNQV